MSASEKAIEEAAKTARRYLDQIVLKPAGALGDLLTDKVNYWKWKNKVDTILRAKRFLEDRGIDPKGVLPSTVVPLLEGAANTDDPMLQQMYSGLLASHAASENPNAVHPSYTKLLEQLAPIDAAILELLHNTALAHAPKTSHRQLILTLDKAAALTSEPDDVLEVSFENIRRLGICDRGVDALADMNKLPQIVYTDYGMLFMKKCRPDAA